MSRKNLLYVVLLLLPVGADGEERGATRVTVYASNISVMSGSRHGTEIWGGVGVGLTYFLSPRFAMEMSYGMDKSYRSEDSIEGEFFRRHLVRAYPLDLTAAYHVRTRTDWKPYVGAGARFVSTPAGVPSAQYNQLHPEIVAGTLYNVSPRLAFRFDAKYIPIGDVPPWSEPVKVSAGVSWRF